MVDFLKLAHCASSVRVNGEWVDLRWPTREDRSTIMDKHWELQGFNPEEIRRKRLELQGPSEAPPSNDEVPPEDDLEALEQQIDAGETPTDQGVIEAVAGEPERDKADNTIWWDTICSMALHATVVTDKPMSVDDWKRIIIASESETPVEGLKELGIEAVRICGFKGMSALLPIQPGEPGSLVRNYLTEAIEEVGELPSQ